MKKLLLGSAFAAVLSLAAIATTLAHATTTCTGLFASLAVALNQCSANSYQLVVPPGATGVVLTQTATPPPTSTATPIPPTATDTSTPSPTATATNSPTPTNTATSTPSPTPTATPLMAQIAPGGSAIITCENGDAPTVTVSGPTAEIDCLAASPTPTWTATATNTPPATATPATPIAALGTPESIYAIANTNAAPIDVSQTYSNGYQSTVVVPADSTVLVRLASVTAVPTNWRGTVQLSAPATFTARIAGFDYR